MTAEQERAAIVAWLREGARIEAPSGMRLRFPMTLVKAADAIEQGKHIKDMDRGCQTNE